MKPLAVQVTGRGCICSLGANEPGCVEALFCPGREPLPRPSKRFTTTHARSYPVFELPPAVTAGLPGDAGLFLTARLSLATGLEALAEAGLAAPGALAGLRVGVCVGTTVGTAMNNEEFYGAWRGYTPQPPDLEPVRAFLRSNPAQVLARELRQRGALPGPVQAVCNACSSGSDAIGLAAGWIAAGLCDLALAGGADELCRTTCNGFISLMIHDQEPCRPFGAGRQGLNLGEGAAMLVLEPAQALRERQRATPPQSRGRILGYGAACDAYHLTAPHPEGRGLRSALRQALTQGGLQGGDIAFVNAHGTGTKDNDRVESLVLAEELPGVPFFSSKGRTGHTLGAAGALEACLTLACLEQGRIPTAPGAAEPDPELPARPNPTAQTVQGRAALSFSLAFGGSNAVLALGAPES